MGDDVVRIVWKIITVKYIILFFGRIDVKIE